MALGDNLVSYFKLNESSGDASDVVGSNTLANSNVTYETGKLSNCAVFNGSTGKLQKTSPSGLPTGSSARTVSFWFNGNTNFDGIGLMYGDANTGGMFCCYLEKGTLIFYGIARDLTKAKTISASTWHHIVYTYDGTTMTIYFNGTNETSGNLSLNTATGTNLSIGQNNGNWVSAPYEGKIDEIGIWSRALSSTEVTELYNSGAGLQYPFATAFIPKIIMF